MKSWIYIFATFGLMLLLTLISCAPKKPAPVRPELGGPERFVFGTPTTIPSVKPETDQVGKSIESVHAKAITVMQKNEDTRLLADVKAWADEETKLAADFRKLAVAVAVQDPKLIAAMAERDEARAIVAKQNLQMYESDKKWKEFSDATLTENARIAQAAKDKEVSRDRMVARIIGGIIAFVGMIGLVGGVALMVNNPLKKALPLAIGGGGVSLIPMGLAVIFNTEIISRFGVSMFLGGAGAFLLLLVGIPIFVIVRESRKNRKIAEATLKGVEAAKVDVIQPENVPTTWENIKAEIKKAHKEAGVSVAVHQMVENLKDSVAAA